MKANSAKVALDLAETFEWRVFPARPDNKAPLIKNWQERASSNPKDITNLFQSFPNAMIGLPTGPINRITVVDLDIKNGVDGLKTITSRGMKMPTRAIAHTPTGGFHLYYNSGTEEYPCSAGKIGPGVDVRGVGGYVIAPGSVALSGCYRWKHDLHKTRYGILPMTVCLKAAITGKSRAKPSKPGFCKTILDPVMEGQRNVEMTRRCGMLFRRGYSTHEVEGLLSRINTRCCSPPLREQELLQIIRSIAKREGK